MPGRVVAGRNRKADLVVEIPEAIIFKQFLLVGRIVIHPVQRGLKSLYDQSPPTVSFPEIDWSIHRLHASLQ